MKSRPIGAGQSILASQNNDRRDDARGAGFLLTHQQLGTLALGTNATNGQTVTFVVNGTSIVATFVSSIGSTANNILIGASAAASVTNLLTWLRRPDLTTSTQVAASSANQTLLQYVGWAWPGSSTNIVPFSLNKNVNGNTDILTSFNITSTVTSGSWTTHLMQLYVQDGTYFLEGTRYLFTGGSTPTVTAPSSHPRIDVLTIDATGTLAWTTGTENASPTAPAYPANKIPICELYNVVGETGLYDNENQQSGQGYIYNDVRPGLVNPYGLFVLDPGSEAQGDVLYYNGAAWARLPAGTSGYVLQTQGASANPQWVLGNTTHTVLDLSAPAATITNNSTYNTISTYSSIPAISANQTIWLRGQVSFSNGSASANFTLGVTMNGTLIFSQSTGTLNTNPGMYFDVLVSVPTPASAQTYMALFTCAQAASQVTNTPGTAAANLSSPFSIVVEAQSSTGATHTTTATLNYLSVFIFN
jgi:hypothetical protein